MHIEDNNHVVSEQFVAFRYLNFDIHTFFKAEKNSNAVRVTTLGIVLFSVSLKFRTLSDNVLLVYNKLVSSTGGSITLGIKDGIPISVLKLGSDTTTVFGGKKLF